MKLNKNDLMKCKQCGKQTLVKDLKSVLEQKDEAGVLADLVCPFCDCPELVRIQKGEVKK